MSLTTTFLVSEHADDEGVASNAPSPVVLTYYLSS